MTDREILVALFKAVTGLAERLTGERMIVAIETEDGWVRLSGEVVEWQPIGIRRPGAVNHPVDLREHAAKPVQAHCVPDAIAPTVLGSGQPSASYLR